MQNILRMALQKSLTYLPEKSVLYRILEMFQCWGPIICPVSKLPLFDSDAWKKANSILLHVKKGWVADLDGIPLYTIEGHDKHGLPIYHSLCGTSSIEGVSTIQSNGTLHH